MFMKWFERAKQMMKQQGITQDDLMDCLEVKTRGAVGHYLTGRRDPSPIQLIALSTKLRCSLDYLLTGKGDSPLPVIENVSPREKAFNDLINSLPKIEQDKLFRELQEKECYFKEVYEDMRSKAG